MLLLKEVLKHTPVVHSDYKALKVRTVQFGGANALDTRNQDQAQRLN